MVILHICMVIIVSHMSFRKRLRMFLFIRMIFSSAWKGSCFFCIWVAKFWSQPLVMAQT